jgi:hypothetical protein
MVPLRDLGIPVDADPLINEQDTGAARFRRLDEGEQRKIVRNDRLYDAYRDGKIPLAGLVARQVSPVWGVSLTTNSAVRALAGEHLPRIPRFDQYHNPTDTGRSRVPTLPGAKTMPGEAPGTTPPPTVQAQEPTGPEIRERLAREVGAYEVELDRQFVQVRAAEKAMIEARNARSAHYAEHGYGSDVPAEIAERVTSTNLELARLNSIQYAMQAKKIDVERGVLRASEPASVNVGYESKLSAAKKAEVAAHVQRWAELVGPGHVDG